MDIQETVSIRSTMIKTFFLRKIHFGALFSYPGVRNYICTVCGTFTVLFTARHNVTVCAMENLLKLFCILSWCNNLLPQSLHLFMRTFKAWTDSLSNHLFWKAIPTKRSHSMSGVLLTYNEDENLKACNVFICLSSFFARPNEEHFKEWKEYS